MFNNLPCLYFMLGIARYKLGGFAVIKILKNITLFLEVTMLLQSPMILNLLQHIHFIMDCITVVLCRLFANWLMRRGMILSVQIVLVLMHFLLEKIYHTHFGLLPRDKGI